MDEKEMTRQREEHNRKLLKAHLNKLKADPERFAHTTTHSEEAELEGKFQAEWEEFKRRYAGKVLQRERHPADPNADFRLLGIPAKSTRAEIRRAFLAKAKTAHPDHGGSPEAFRQIMAAYHRLTEGKG
ncbi:MAG: DnaJ domain-containing protein [SAR324 cluster bacterium]